MNIINNQRPAEKIYEREKAIRIIKRRIIRLILFWLLNFVSYFILVLKILKLFVLVSKLKKKTYFDLRR